MRAALQKNKTEEATAGRNDVFTPELMVLRDYIRVEYERICVNSLKCRG